MPTGPDRSKLEIPDLLAHTDEPLPAILVRPADASALLVLAHGAGAGMSHFFMDGVAERLAEHDVATLRFEFAYMAAGRRAPDPPKRLIQAVSRAVAFARTEFPDLSVFGGGKSLGGRMTSTAVSQGLTGLKGLVFFGFPLHAPGRKGTERARHLLEVSIPMLFLQGTRDKLAEIGRMRDVVRGLDDAELVEVEDADHSFHVPKRSGRTDDEVLDGLAATAAEWINARA